MSDGIVTVVSDESGDMVVAYKLVKLTLENHPMKKTSEYGDWCHVDSVQRYSPHLGEKPPKIPALINLKDVIQNLPPGSIIEILVPDDH